MAVNVYGVIRTTHAFVRLIKRRQGRIVTVSSIAARMPFPTTAPYVASKFAVQGYIDTLR